MRSVEYIIVGQGLAGTCVALQLRKRQKSFIVISKENHSRSSLVAAGLFNPVTGNKLTRTWMADIIFPYLHDFYRQAEALTSKQFFHPMPLYRPFISVEEQNTWLARSADSTYNDIIESVSDHSSDPDVRDSLGGVWLKQSGYINTSLFLSAVRNMLVAENSYEEEIFDYGKLRLTTGVSYGMLSADKIIFCEGYRVAENPWFQTLPVRPLKGETIDVKSGFQKHVILNRGVYMVPGNGDGRWRVGSTYNVRDMTAGITPDARSEMESKLKELVHFPFEIEAQDWGIRPTTSDRRPILGNHVKHPQMSVFNGLGTKGVTLAPYFSEMLIHWLEDPARSLNKEVEATRFKSLY